MEFEQVNIFEEMEDELKPTEEELERNRRVQRELYGIHLNTRQWRTYELIKRNTLMGRTTTQREIVDNYPAPFYKDGYVWNDDPRTHDHCSTIWHDLDKINGQDNMPKAIIWDEDYNYKIAEDRDEADAFCKRMYWSKAMAKLWRYGNIMRKVNRDGQTRIMFTDETEARDYWQTFFHNHLDDLVNQSLGGKEDEGDSQ